MTALPEPDRDRWQPLRLGLVELYHYDVEEFAFRDGHLLLRGNNGTGKSKVLSLTLPFLLDADLRSSRVEPDGDRQKRMDWNLLMGGRHDRRTGYTWIEFGRRDDAGNTVTLTLGAGLRAVSGRGSVDSWFFVTEQRIGRDLSLVTAERTAISQERLADAIGAHGRVFKTARDYRRAVDERLFRIGAERYDALVETLIQLRQPQLSKQPNEQRLSDALTEALAPLDRASLESVAEAMGQLEELKRELGELEAMRHAVAAFGDRYRRYAQIAARRKARTVRQAQTEWDNASRDLNAAERTLEKARERVQHWLGEQRRLDDALAAGRARLEVLQADPVMRDAQRIADARKAAEQCRSAWREAEQRATVAKEQVDADQRGTAARRRDVLGTRAEVGNAQRGCEEQAEAAGIASDHGRTVAELRLPDGPAGAEGEPGAWLAAANAIAQRRREQIDVIRRRLQAVTNADRERAAARSARDQSANAFDAAAESLAQSVDRLRAECREALAAWRTYVAGLEVLELAAPEELLAGLEDWLETLAGANPLRAALDESRAAAERTLAARETELGARRAELEGEATALREERARLERGEDQPPPEPYTRGAGVRAARTEGAPLWRLVDFAAPVGERERAGLEAALEASGLLDAWLMPTGALLDPATHDVVLTARAERAASLADWLVPTIPPDARGVDAAAVQAVLRSIACAEAEDPGAEAWLSPHGEFRVGTARGAWAKPVAQYVGHAAREAARRARLAEIATRLEALNSELAELADRQRRCEALRTEARAEHARSPGDEPVQRAHAERGAAERERRHAQARLAEAEARLVATEQVVSEARARLAADARDLGLPGDTEGVDRVERAVGNYRLAASELSSAVRAHWRALIELADQERREARAAAAAAAADEDRAAKGAQLHEADARVESLQATVGKQVADLLSEIEAARAALQRDEKLAKDVRAQHAAASGQRGTAENDRNAKDARRSERDLMRKAAVAALEAFAVETGLMAVALGAQEEPVALPAAPWGVDAALTLARRAEAALAGVAAEDSDWSRVSGELGRDFNDLQQAMSAHGHSATAEPNDHGFVIRIVYQQRSERPDVLLKKIDDELGQRRAILTARERDVLEEHLEKEIAANLQRMIQDTERRVAEINAELARRPTSTGVRYRLVWQSRAEDADGGVPGLAEARRRLLKTSADAWSAEDRRQVGEFLQRRIAAESAGDEQVSMFDSLSRALDYRRWHRFSVQRHQDGQWRPLAGPASSGERALGLTVPLFAACSSHYESADRHAPRLVLLDEAFAGIDDEARASCMALIREFDLDFVMTSEREWGCYPELPGLSICQLVRREGVDAVYVSRWSWNGRVRTAVEDSVRRFPEETAVPGAFGDESTRP